MTKEELAQIAEEEGLFLTIGASLYRFAERVAAAEREACAAICDRIASPLPGESLEGWREGYVDGAGACRNLIRKRGQE